MKDDIRDVRKMISIWNEIVFNGKLQKGKTLTFKFNGKTYEVKTNSKGIAQKALNKNIIKKLKKGKKYSKS